MRFSQLALAAFPLLASGAAVPEAQITPAPLIKRADGNQRVLSDAVWTTTSTDNVKIIMAVTPTVIDGVTISASPVNSATPWVSLDESGIPYMVTPTVSNGVTVSSSPTPTSGDYITPQFVPPVLRCFGDRVPEDNNVPGYPFCTPRNGTEVVVGETYWITWDPTYWGSTDVKKVKIELVAYPQNGAQSELLDSDYISNVDGYYPLYIQGSFIRDGNGYFFVTITPLTTSGTTAKNVGTKSGPLIRAITSKNGGSQAISRVPSDNVNGGSSSSSSSSSSGSNAKVIAPAVIVPVVFFAVVAFFVVSYLRKQKKSTGASQDGDGEIQLSPSTTHNDVASVTTTETANPFKETSRTVL